MIRRARFAQAPSSSAPRRRGWGLWAATHRLVSYTDISRLHVADPLLRENHWAGNRHFQYGVALGAHPAVVLTLPWHAAVISTRGLPAERVASADLAGRFRRGGRLARLLGRARSGSARGLSGGPDCDSIPCCEDISRPRSRETPESDGCLRDRRRCGAARFGFRSWCASDASAAARGGAGTLDRLFAAGERAVVDGV